MPVVGPTPVIACGVACLTAAAWSPTTIFGKVIGLAGLAIGMVVSLLVFHTQSGNLDPILMAIGRAEYFDFGWQQYAAFLVTVEFKPPS